MTDNKQEISEYALFLWKEYNSKGIRPPFEMTEKFMRLRGLPEEDIELAKAKHLKQQEDAEKKQLKKEKKEKKEKRVDKFFMKMWTKYNTKGMRPPLDTIKKLAKLQGKSQEFIDSMEYEDFKGIKAPYECNEEEYEEQWALKPIDVSSTIQDDWLVDSTNPKKTNLETPLEDVMSGKALINPAPLYEIKRGGRGYYKAPLMISKYSPESCSSH